MPARNAEPMNKSILLHALVWLRVRGRALWLTD